MADLTEKQKRFVEEYLVDLNATQAAIRAGYSKDTAYAIGWENLRKPEISEAISTARQEQTKRTQIDADWILQRLAMEADADIADLYDDNGALKPVAEWPVVWRTGLISGIETEQEFEEVAGKKVPAGIVHKVKISDRVRRLELLGKHVRVGAFTERHEHSGPEGGPIETVDLTPSEAARRIAFILQSAIKH